MSDPLFLLRQATINKTPPTLSDGFCDFGHIRLPENTKTCFRRTLKKNINVPLAEYRRKLVAESKRGITAVTEPDRPFLQQYINGEIETCSQIDLSQIQSLAPLSQIQSSDNATQSKPSKSKEERSKQKHEGEDKGEKLEKSKRRKHEHVSLDDAAIPMDKALIDSDKPLLAAIRAGEFAPYSRNSFLNTDNPKVDFSSVLKIFNDSILKPKDNKSGAAQSQDKPMAGATSKAPLSTTTPINKPSGAPIIIVPKSMSSDINMANIKQFLEEGKYVKVSQGQFQNRLKQISIERISPVDPTKKLHYKVLEDPTVLSPADWDRVIAVFVAGQSWQFREWKYSDPVNLFQHALGAYIAADDRVPEPAVATWNCRIFKANSVKDHVTTSASKDFWALLDNFVKFHHPQFDPAKL